jgi:hypothetical protein
MRSPEARRRVQVVLAIALAWAMPVEAQVRRAAVDVVVSADAVGGSTPPRAAGVWFDAFGAIRLGDGVDVVARPVVWRRAFDGAWDADMYRLGIQVERRRRQPGDLGVRLELGQIPSPIGLAMLENRADLNPVVSQHSAYYVPLPRVDREMPRTYLIAGAYPLGAQVTIAAGRWDARAAVLDSSPVRGRPLLGASKPPRLLNVAGGFGVTPRVGLRLGAGVAHGAYASVDEVIDRRRGDREATLVQVEVEWSFGHTRIAGEWVRSIFETARADAHATGGWIEATQTLMPRVFVAGRADAQSFECPHPTLGSLVRQDYGRYEAVVGVRVTPDLTVRGGYLVRKGYVVSHWDDQIIGSIVWTRALW